MVESHALLPAGKGIVIALAVVRAAGLAGGQIPIDLILIQIHHTVVFVKFLVVIVIPASFAQIVHNVPLPYGIPLRYFSTSKG